MSDNLEKRAREYWLMWKPRFYSEAAFKMTGICEFAADFARQVLADAASKPEEPK